jgi:putative cardiolipin synthase
MRRLVKGIGAALVLLVVAIFVARIVFALPDVSRVETTALPPAESGPLAEAVRFAGGEPGLTGVSLLPDGAGAFAARMALAEAATQSIDARYYIWKDDVTGTLLLDALTRAADRGVRVRLLLDDNGTSGIDGPLARLDAHPNAEIRLWNPFNLRRPKFLAYAFDFPRLNRRMHNKSFTADGLLTVLGGRNVGDEYFGTGPTPLYVDLDLVAAGNAVAEEMADFDAYWSAPSSYPVASLMPLPTGDPLADGMAALQGSEELAEYTEVIASSPITRAVLDRRLEVDWIPARVLSDDPSKGLGEASEGELLAERLALLVTEVEGQFDGVSPYFVPGKAGTEWLGGMAASGRPVRILTNSLAATDVLPVHAGYAKRREALLSSGVVLYELRREATPDLVAMLGPFGSSGASLHAKTFAVGDAWVFVGSMNFDPRSTFLNTEMGIVLESEDLAQRVHGSFDRELAELAWKVELRETGLVWIDPRTGAETSDEPGSSALSGFLLSVIGALPVEWLL